MTDKPSYEFQGWDHFIAECLDKRPVVIPFGRLFATPEESFNWIVAAAEASGSDFVINNRFYIETTALEANREDNLPRRSDGSLAGYASRVTNFIGGRRFGLVVNNIQQVDFEIFAR